MAEPRRSLARHHMVRVAPQAWRRLLAGQCPEPLHALLDVWADNKWPLVARRPVCGDPPGQLPLGLPLPPAHGKLRLSFTLAEPFLRGVMPPPRLADAASCAPVAWQEGISRILSLDADARCFGSLAWQYLTGLRYLSGTSDLDLLCRACSRAHADALAGALVRIDADTPMAIDGELLAPSGGAVQWREWASDAQIVMVKTRDGVQLMPRRQVFA